MTGSQSEELPEMMFSDASAWREWLAKHHAKARGVWLVLSRKGTTTPTRLTYDEALEEALSHGWIDGLTQGRDDATYRMRFTPRRKRSAWSKRNTVIAERLMDEGRMHAAGIAEIERAKSDGRWQAAYHGSAAIEVPDDLAAALNAEPAAKAMFAILSAQNRYAVLYRIQAAKRPETRARRIERFVAMLARGETVYAQRKTLSR
ncbi:MAG TPA: YdeI/OmpD-associated family protein [Candidatus Dormibacteraeota bacterium]|nr:YdeI/OmpD-associated family protein [Candidatus Dormibacteraeota bacterium]